MSSPFFSIILPTRNQVDHLGEALASVQAQTFRDFELLVIDDGSTDQTPEFLRQFRKQNEDKLRLQLFRQEPRNVATARNRGAAESTGHWLAFLHADDRWLPQRLALAHEILTQSPFLGLFAQQARIFREDKLQPPTPFVTPQILTEAMDPVQFLMTTHPTFPTSAVVVSLEAFRAVDGFHPDMSRGEDLDLWMRIALHHKIRHDNTVVAEYRLYGHGAEQAGNEIQKAERLLQIAHNALAAAPPPRKDQATYLGNLMFDLHKRLAQLLLDAGQKEKAKAHLRTAWQMRKTEVGLLFKSILG